jgi:hypothetical protein
MDETTREAPRRSYLMSVPEAAEQLSTSQSWVRRHLPLLELGDGERGRAKVVRVRRRDVERVLLRAQGEL